MPLFFGDRLSAPGIRDLALHYEGRAIFAWLELDVEPGAFVMLLGVSGGSKSSLVRIIAGLDRPSAGTVAAADGRPLARRVAYMGQYDLLYPWLDAARNVMLGAQLRGERCDRARALGLLKRVRLADRAGALPSQLSGGMRQRVALARTLYQELPVVLMDEPFATLDTVTRARMQDLAAELLRGRTVLLITHDPLEACRLGQHLLVLSGAPVTLGAPISNPGATPRAPDDDAVLHVQGRLLRGLHRLCTGGRMTTWLPNLLRPLVTFVVLVGVMLNANARIQTDVMFAALFVLALMAVGLWVIVDRVLRRILFWAPDTSMRTG